MPDSTSNPSSWNIRGEALLPDDPLTRCLVILTRFFHNPMSAQTLTAGLPLENMRLTPELFVRSAARAGLSARVIKRPLDQISSLTLPAVLLLKNGNACVVSERHKNLGWVVIQPESGAGKITMTTEQLAAQYDGFAIFSRPVFKFDERVEDQSIPRGQHWFWSVFTRSWPLYAEVLIATFLTNVFALVTPLYVMNVYDRVVPNMAMETLWVLSTGVLIVFVFDLLMRSLRAYFLDVAGKQIDVVLSATIFERVLGLKLAARPRSVGTLANNLQEFEMFRDFITSATITAVIDLPFVVLFLVIIFWIGGATVAVPILAIPIIVGLAMILQRPLQSVIQQTFRVSSQKQAVLIETLTGMDTIKAVGAEGTEQRKWEQIIAEQNRLGLKSRILTNAIVNQSSFFQQAAYVCVVIVGVYLIADRSLTTGGLIACALLTNRVLSPLSQVASLITRYFQAQQALAGIDNIMNLPVERPAGKSFVHRPGFKGDIEFRNVTFSYPAQEVTALNNVSFRIRQGEQVGIIGRIGSGKTTIERLLLGLYDPTQGSIWIDGIDLQQIDPADLRQNIGYVPQDVMLFHGSVRENIVLGAPYVDDAAMLAAAEVAGVTEFVNRHPRGFDMQVGERGEGLSGGQRQSIANARALLLDPPIIVLDEPSSSLDNRSEENLKAKLTAQLGGRTLILVTHRASLLTMVNRLIVMDGGRVIADGPKDQVMEALSGGKLHVAKQ